MKQQIASRSSSLLMTSSHRPIDAATARQRNSWFFSGARTCRGDDDDITSLWLNALILLSHMLVNNVFLLLVTDEHVSVSLGVPLSLQMLLKASSYSNCFSLASVLASACV